MILVKATRNSEAAVMPSEDLMNEMGRYHEELAKAGVLMDANGLQASSKGFRIRYSGDTRTVQEGPFNDTWIAGYTVIKVTSRQQAIDWAKRYPNPYQADGEIEVRQIFELEDFPQNEATERFRELEGTSKS
jgi:hypothetical protein